MTINEPKNYGVKQIAELFPPLMKIKDKLLREKVAAVWNEAISANPNLPLANSFLAGAAKTRGEEDAAAEFEERANSVTVDDPYFHWMLGLRLENVGMSELAEKHFSRAIQLDPKFRMRSTIDALTMPTAK